MRLGIFRGAVQVPGGGIEVLGESLVIELDGHAIVAAQVALDAGAAGVPANVARGDQRTRHVAGGNLDQHRRLGRRIHGHSGARGDCLAELLDVIEQHVVTGDGLIGAELGAFALQPVPVGLDGGPALADLEARANLAVAGIDFVDVPLHLGFRGAHLVAPGGIAGQHREQAAAMVGCFRQHAAEGLHVAGALDLILGEARPGNWRRRGRRLPAARSGWPWPPPAAASFCHSFNRLRKFMSASSSSVRLLARCWFTELI